MATFTPPFGRPPACLAPLGVGAQPIRARALLAALPLALAALSTGCESGSKAALTVPQGLASVTMLSDGAAALLEGIVEVSPLIGPGVDPHLFRPTRSDMAKLTAADPLLRVGLHLEANLESAFERLPETVALSAFLPEAELLSTPIAGASALAAHDPHVWMDPALWSLGVQGLAAHLAQRYPERSQEILERGERYCQELLALDRYTQACIDSIPKNQRVLVTAHDAFRYFGRRYGVEVLGLQGLSTESEAGLERLSNLVETLTERQLPAVFVESSVSQQGVRALIAGAAKRGHTVQLGGLLYSDATGSAGTFEGSLVGMLAHNAETITQALGGTVPEGGYARWRELDRQSSAPALENARALPKTPAATDLTPSAQTLAPSLQPNPAPL